VGIRVGRREGRGRGRGGRKGDEVKRTGGGREREGQTTRKASV
jgi:hypothetical protein